MTISGNGGPLMDQERWLLAIMVLFNAGIRLSSFDDATVSTWKTLGDEHLDPSPGVFILSVPLAVDDSKGDWYLRYVLAGPSIAR